MSLANALRLQAGGSLPTVPTDDPIVESLATIARDAYPALLVPPGHGPSHSRISGSFIHPASRRFQQAVLDDEQLGARFSGPVDTTAGFLLLHATTGHGEGGVQLCTLADRLLATPSVLGRARGITAEEFIAEAVRAVAHLRRLVGMGRTVRSPALVGLGDLAIPAGTQLATTWGTIRGLTDGERTILGAFAGSGNGCSSPSSQSSFTLTRRLPAG